MNGDIITRSDYDRTRKQMEASLREQGSHRPAPGRRHGRRRAEHSARTHRPASAAVQSQRTESQRRFRSGQAARRHSAQRQDLRSRQVSTVRQRSNRNVLRGLQERSQERLTDQSRDSPGSRRRRIQIKKEEAQKYYDLHQRRFQARRARIPAGNSGSYADPARMRRSRREKGQRSIGPRQERREIRRARAQSIPMPPAPSRTAISGLTKKASCAPKSRRRCGISRAAMSPTLSTSATDS